MKKHNKNKLVKEILDQDLDKIDLDELMELLTSEPLAIDIDKQEENKKTFQDRLADGVTRVTGSWGFIISFLVFLLLWMLLNYFEVIKIDPYPFILLNLLLSCIAALQAPIIMMSQNREAKKDSLRSLNDYKTDLKSELIVEVLQEEIKEIKDKQKEILALLNKNKN